MEDYTKILLQRREEILEQVNKLTKEYKALGDALMKIYKYEKKEKKGRDKDDNIR